MGFGIGGKFDGEAGVFGEAHNIEVGLDGILAGGEQFGGEGFLIFGVGLAGFIVEGGALFPGDGLGFDDGAAVEEGAGTLEMNPSWTPESPKSIKKWLTFHAEGECPSGIVAGVPEGRYALEVDGTMKFYVVANGAVYAKASDDEHLITNADTVDAVLTSIRFDIETAARRYGIELGECGRCGRALTSDWRLKGMGPVCSQKAW